MRLPIKLYQAIAFTNLHQKSDRLTFQIVATFTSRMRSQRIQIFPIHEN
ncbi:hypothetical protein LC593_31160 [Nostoc sp. CHAB 5844]|nr:hypothetical protein [Nostoc sp. CHAB 5844]